MTKSFCLFSEIQSLRVCGAQNFKTIRGISLWATSVVQKLLQSAWMLALCKFLRHWNETFCCTISKAAGPPLCFCCNHLYCWLRPSLKGPNLFKKTEVQSCKLLKGPNLFEGNRSRVISDGINQGSHPALCFYLIFVLLVKDQNLVFNLVLKGKK